MTLLLLLLLLVRVSVVTFLLSTMRLRHTVLLESDHGRNTWKIVRHRRRTDNAQPTSESLGATQTQQQNTNISRI